MIIVHVEQPNKFNFVDVDVVAPRRFERTELELPLESVARFLSFSTTSFGMCASLIIVGQLNTCDRIVSLEIISEPRDVQTVLDGRRYAVLSGKSSSLQIREAPPPPPKNMFFRNIS